MSMLKTIEEKVRTATPEEAKSLKDEALHVIRTEGRSLIQQHGPHGAITIGLSVWALLVEDLDKRMKESGHVCLPEILGIAAMKGLYDELKQVADRLSDGYDALEDHASSHLPPAKTEKLVPFQLGDVVCLKSQVGMPEHLVTRMTIESLRHSETHDTHAGCTWFAGTERRSELFFTSSLHLLRGKGVSDGVSRSERTAGDEIGHGG